MKPTILIIGAGLFGMHIAYKLSDIAKHVHVYELNDAPFKGAASNNQHRFHAGFHYPRSQETIKQINDSAYSFYKNFPNSIFEINSNYYCVAKDNSKINTDDFLKTFINNSKRIEEKQLDNLLELSRLESVFSVPEKGINLTNLKQTILDNLQKKHNVKLFFNQSNVEKQFNRYDFIINSSYWSTHLTSDLDVKYELCMLLKVKNLFKDEQTPSSLTVIDGMFPSVYETEDNGVYTISSVQFTPFYKTKSLQEFYYNYNNLQKQFDLKQVANKIFDHALEYYKLNKEYDEVCKYITPKIKILDDFNDLRTSQILHKDKFITILQGKISTLDKVAQEILETINYANI